jgi:hypothetical protein
VIFGAGAQKGPLSICFDFRASDYLRGGGYCWGVFVLTMIGFLVNVWSTLKFG